MNRTQTASGLGSLQGIRWLLAVGALTLAVSVYRLVESQWAGMSVITQFLTLATGSLAVFGAGEVLRNRLRLPIAGSALQWLFAVLVPVLSWGAAYLNLLSSPWGAAVYGGSIMVLLAAFRRCLKEALRYDGVLYTLAFGFLTVSLPLMSMANVEGRGSIVGALGLGGVFHIGARHINRFLFHRDRRDGIDRPIHALPFVALSVLYVASLSLLGLSISHVALPLFVLGAALVSTGEEYYYALVRSLRGRPSAWPRRSVALLALGFTLVAIASPLSFLDATGRVPAIVFCAVAALLFRWSFRYEKATAHVAAMLAAVVGYQFLPALMPTIAVEGAVSLVERLGLTNPVAITAFAQLGLGCLFTFLSRHTTLRVHAITATVHLTAIVALSGLSGVAGAKIVAPLALGLASLSAFLTRRSEWNFALHAALGASVLAWGGAYGMEILALVLTAIVVSKKLPMLVPMYFWAFVIGISGIVHFVTGGALEVLLAGVLFIALGHRMENPLSILVGVGALSLGLHGELAFTFEASRTVLALATLFLFAVSVLVRRRANDVWALGAQGSMLGHGVLGISWFYLALALGPLTIEPLILALFGWAVLSHGLRGNNESDAGFGLGLLVAYPPVHLWAAGYIGSVPTFLMIALASLLVARALATPILSKSVEKLFRVWRTTSIIAALFFIGMEVLALAATVVLVGALRGKPPYRSVLLVLGHTLVWLEGASIDFFPLALIEASATAFPLAAALALAWILLVESTTDAKAIVPWTMAIEAFVMFGFLVGAIPIGIFTAWNYGALIVIALAFALRHAKASYRLESTGRAWTMQIWFALAVLAGYYGGWVSFGNGRAPYVLLASGAIQYGLAGLFECYRKARPLAVSSLWAGQALVLFGGLVALVRLQAIPLFLASLFYLILASRGTKRVTASVLSAFFLGFGLVAIAWGHGVGMEFYSLAPGFTLVALALLLVDEMGPRWSRHVFTAGAAFIYATPVLALYDEITWAWQAVLLVLTVGFGGASFWLKSRPLLTVSTAALVIDLACFVVKIRETEPLLLWVGGVMLGVGLMTLAAYLEYRREGLAQQIRVFGRELAGWY